MLELTIADLSDQDLLINEVMANPTTAVDSDGEWLEIRNPYCWSVDLNGLVIRDLGTDSHTVSSRLVVDGFGVVVLGSNPNAAMNGGVTLDYTWTGIALANGDDEVILEGGNGEITRLEYVGAPFTTSGASAQLDAGASNDDVTADWCSSTRSFGVDLGTPGRTNDSCP